jgi:hypothetical protein
LKEQQLARSFSNGSMLKTLSCDAPDSFWPGVFSALCKMNGNVAALALKNKINTVRHNSLNVIAFFQSLINHLTTDARTLMT